MYQSRMLASVLFSVVSIATAEVPDVSASRLSFLSAARRRSLGTARRPPPRCRATSRPRPRRLPPSPSASLSHSFFAGILPTHSPLLCPRHSRSHSPRINLAAQAEPAHTYTHIKGALGKDNDAVPPQNLTLAAAEAKCSALPNCTGVTFASNSERPAGVVHAYFKKKDCGAPYGADGWQTYLRDYTPPPPPPPPSAFCPKYHPIRKSQAYPHHNFISTDVSDRSPVFADANSVYDPSGPLLDKSGTWHTWEDDGGWSHWGTKDLIHVSHSF